MNKNRLTQQRFITVRFSSQIGFRDGSFDLYEPGAAAEEGLERIAEDGSPMTKLTISMLMVIEKGPLLALEAALFLFYTVISLVVMAVAKLKLLLFLKEEAFLTCFTFGGVAFYFL